MSRWNVARLTSWRSSPVDTLSRSRRSRRRMLEPLESRWLLSSDPLVELNLASNEPGMALVNDPSLGFAWGISTSPGNAGAFSVSDTAAGRSNSYSGDVAGSPFVQNASQAVNVPVATGQVYNSSTTEFATRWPVLPPGSMLAQQLKPTEFLYASLDGSIYGYSPTIGQQAVQEVSVNGASFTGLALANNGTTDQLYATDFLGGKIDVFAPNFSPVTPSGSFTDPNLPAGYKPFNIQALDGNLYVSYAPQGNTNGSLPPVPAPGGVVDVFDTNGNFIGRVASGSPLDQPWGMALAPASFGPFAGDLLVANHGDGKINVFNPTPSSNGAAALGTLSGADGDPFSIDGLWGLAVGNGSAGDSSALYFTAGGFQNLDWPLGAAGGAPIDSSMPIASFSQGLLGTIRASGTNPLVADGTDTSVLVGKQFSGALAAFGSADLPSPTANPVVHYTATIDWGDGNSTSQATIANTGNGGFVVEGQHTYSSVGADNYTVTIDDGVGNSVTATGTVEVSPATLVATALSLTSPEPTITNRILAEFIDTAGVDSRQNYSATIDWGDGTTSAGAIQFFVAPLPGTSGATPFGGPAFYVVGSHTYAAAGDYTFGVTISDTPDSLQTSVTGMVDIAQPTLVAKALPVTSQGLTINNAEVAGFSDTGGPDQVSDYTATIAWGDGATTTGTVFPANGNNFFVSGSHTYVAAGDYMFTVAISDTQDNLETSFTGTLSVAAPTLVAKAQPVTSQGLNINNNILAEFLDTGGLDPQTNYNATIDWGDGTTTTGTILEVVADPPGTPPFVGPIFLVEGSHTYATAGDHTFTVSISDTADSLQTSVTGTIDFAQATLVAKALPVTSQEFSVNSGLAEFIDTGGADPLTNYSATIDWGDGTTSAGTINIVVADPPGTIPFVGPIFFVSGSHTYAAAGDHTFTVTISDTPDSLQITVTGTVNVAQATLAAKALPVESQGLNINNVNVAVFHDTGGADPLADYTATIDWGDGTSTAATVTGGVVPLNATDLGGYFNVEGSHTYATAGDHTFTVTIADTADSLQTSVTGTVQIGQATLMAKALPTEIQGLNVANADLAVLLDTGGADATSDYTATIDWGDGTSSAGTVTSGVSPADTFSLLLLGAYFTVSGNHVYAKPGDYTFTVSIDDIADSLITTATGTIDAAQATLVAHALPVQNQGLIVNNASVATFFDTGGADPLSDYTATIDWGDGATTAGTVTSALVPLNATAIGGSFFVSGSHTYAAAGDYTLTVTISDTHDSLQTSVTGTVSAAAPTLNATALPVVSQGLSVDNATLASFIDTGGADASTDYTATIDWGDGTTTAGTIHEVMAGGVAGGANGSSPMVPFVGGIFFVEGSHTYTAAGDYTFSVTIADTPDTLQTTVTGTVTAAQATLVAHAAPVESQGLTLNNAALAVFVDTGGPDLLSDYTATINWGDGQTSAGTFGPSGIDPALKGSIYLRVEGSHTYTATGAYTFTVAISDTKDNLQTTVTGTAHISPAPLLAVGVPVVVNTGLSANGAIVAAFADGSGGDALTNYSATIDWGDGTSTTVADSISGSGNSFIVTGSHTYAAGGDYKLNIAIADQDGSTANVAAHAFINSPVASFVTTAFQDVLHRASDDSGLNYWTQQIAGGTSPSQFAGDLTHSAEYYATNVIDPAYQTFLGRAADAAGVAYWTAQMQQGMSDQQIEAEFISSPEFYANAGGTNAGWINALYQTVLGRSADGAGMSYWASQLAGGASRSTVAIDFAASQEHVTQAIQNDYFTYLGRAASASEVNYWVAQFEHGASNEDIVSGFVGSPEFYKLHS